MREKYESLSLAVLKDLAKARGMKGISTLRKPALIERMLEEDAKGTEEGNVEEAKQTTSQNNTPKEKKQQNERTEYRTRTAGDAVQERREYRTDRSEQEHRNGNVRREYGRDNYRKSMKEDRVSVRTGMKQKHIQKELYRQNRHSWTAERKPTESWKCFLTDMALSDVRIICRVRTTFMFLLPRSAALI